MAILSSGPWFSSSVRRDLITLFLRDDVRDGFEFAGRRSTQVTRSPVEQGPMGRM